MKLKNELQFATENDVNVWDKNQSRKQNAINIESISLLESITDNMLFFLEEISGFIKKIEIYDSTMQDLKQNFEIVFLITNNLTNILMLKQSQYNFNKVACDTNRILLKVYSNVLCQTRFNEHNNIKIQVAKNYDFKDKFYGEPKIITMILTLLINSSFLQNINENIRIQSRISSNIACFEIITEGIEITELEKFELFSIFQESLENKLTSSKTYIWQLIVKFVRQSGYRLKVLLSNNYFLGFTLYIPSQDQ